MLLAPARIRSSPATKESVPIPVLVIVALWPCTIEPPADMWTWRPLIVPAVWLIAPRFEVIDTSWPLAAVTAPLKLTVESVAMAMSPLVAVRLPKLTAPSAAWLMLIAAALMLSVPMFDPLPAPTVPPEVTLITPVVRPPMSKLFTPLTSIVAPVSELTKTWLNRLFWLRSMPSRAPAITVPFSTPVPALWWIAPLAALRNTRLPRLFAVPVSAMFRSPVLLTVRSWLIA